MGVHLLGVLVLRALLFGGKDRAPPPFFGNSHITLYITLCTTYRCTVCYILYKPSGLSGVSMGPCCGPCLLLVRSVLWAPS